MTITIIAVLIGMLCIYLGGMPQRKKEKIAPLPTDKQIKTELVPLSMQGINVRSRVDSRTWTSIAHKSHKLNSIKFKLKKDECEVCRSNGRKQGFKHPLEAHEEWVFNHDTRTQKLQRIRSLCPLCHKAVHIGLADKNGYGEQVRKHMQKVNGWTAEQVEAHIEQAKQTVRAMNKMGQYKLDLTLLNNREYAGTHQYRFTTNETYNCRANIYY